MKHFYAHLDADSFFVACERTRHPHLRHIPVVVGGRGDQHIFSQEGNAGKQAHLMRGGGHFVPTVFSSGVRDITHKQIDDSFVDSGRIRGIVIAASYEAKLQFGIKTGMVLGEALARCRQLTVVPTNHLLYHQISHAIQSYLMTQCALSETYSVDEMFLDFCGMCERLEEVYEECRRIQSEIMERFGIPVSIGISDRSKWCAKFASDYAKPFNLCMIPSPEWIPFIRDKPIESFPGIGRAFSKKLHKLGIETLGECVDKPHLFEQWWRVGGRELYRRILGQDGDPVSPANSRKGVGISRNFDPIRDRTEVSRRITILCRHLAHTIHTLGVHPLTFHFSLRYEIQGYKNQKSITENRLFHEKYLIELAQRVILKELDIYQSLRVIYVSVSGTQFMEQKRKTLNLLEYEKDYRQTQLDMAMQRLRGRYGMDILRHGNEF